ncbi:MAG: tyrosine-type recombinase/integrase [Oscillospiraceae bacterium]|nr:tyrosine-type recombinase/integrase [Oscillospiraceae bacterium]
MARKKKAALTPEYLSEQLNSFVKHLELAERSLSTCTQYLRDLQQFIAWLGDAEVERSTVLCYKEKLRQEYKPSSVNTKLAAMNSFFKFLERGDLRVEQISIQRRAYCSSERLLSMEEYFRLVEAAEASGNTQLALIIQTICGTGIRVSELAYITAGAVAQGEATVSLKGKTRQILISSKLRRKLKEYAKKTGIKSGPLFVSKTGRPLDRTYIWRKMKELCGVAGVEPSKVFPHNLRHLFARTFYKRHKDIAKLADILGHSSINTTRIYIISTGKEHEECIDCLGLVS